MVVEGASSLGEAYNVGQRAVHATVIVFLHQDTRLLIPGAAKAVCRFLEHRPGGTLLGAIGSTEPGFPWWSFGDVAGAVLGSPYTRLPTEPRPVATLDGVVLVQKRPPPWAPLPGWHGYDTNRSLEAPEVWVHPALFCEHRPKPRDEDNLRQHQTTCWDLARRWGVPCGYRERGN